jgi:hypothetical protein
LDPLDPLDLRRLPLRFRMKNLGKAICLGLWKLLGLLEDFQRGDRLLRLLRLRRTRLCCARGYILTTTIREYRKDDEQEEIRRIHNRCSCQNSAENKTRPKLICVSQTLRYYVFYI